MGSQHPLAAFEYIALHGLKSRSVLWILGSDGFEDLVVVLIEHLHAPANRRPQ